MNIKRITIMAAAVLALAACADGSQSDAEKAEEAVADRQLEQFSTAQPVPLFNASQLRQNLIDIESAQANATVTTSFFFNLGVVDPVHACPSVGFPIPGTFQLTNPGQIVRHRESLTVLPQLEANGVYTGDTSGTTVICIDSAGRGYAHWWEGFVSTVAGPAEWNGGQIVLVGEPSAEFSTGGE